MDTKEKLAAVNRIIETGYKNARYVIAQMSVDDNVDKDDLCDIMIMVVAELYGNR